MINANFTLELSAGSQSLETLYVPIISTSTRRTAGPPPDARLHSESLTRVLMPVSSTPSTTSTAWQSTRVHQDDLRFYQHPTLRWYYLTRHTRPNGGSLSVTCTHSADKLLSKVQEHLIGNPVARAGYHTSVSVHLQGYFP